MPRVELEQDSEEWHKLRSEKLGASDVASIMGVSPYRSPYELWLLKTKRIPPFTQTDAMLYGKRMEPILREAYFEQTNELFAPAVYIHDEHDFLMASLDGLSFDEDKILEIKACNKEVFTKAQQGEVAEHYFPQLQMQLSCVPTAQEVHFHCYHKQDTVTVIVRRDDEFIKKMLYECQEFWDHVINDCPPPAKEEDCMLIDNDPEFEAAVVEWRMLNKQLSKTKRLVDEAKKKLINLTDDGNVTGYGVEVKKSYGFTTDYRKACIDAELDLSTYKKERVNWSIKELKSDVAK